jgi:hypothetical protein
MAEYEDVIEFTENCERSHRDYLREFQEKIYPIFRSHGFSFAEAYNQWTLNKIHCALDTALDRLDAIDRHIAGDYTQD